MKRLPNGPVFRAESPYLISPNNDEGKWPEQGGDCLSRSNMHMSGGSRLEAFGYRKSTEILERPFDKDVKDPGHHDYRDNRRHLFNGVDRAEPISDGGDHGPMGDVQRIR